MFIKEKFKALGRIRDDLFIIEKEELMLRMIIIFST